MPYLVDIFINIDYLVKLLKYIGMWYASFASGKKGRAGHAWKGNAAYDEIHMAHVYSTYVYIHIFFYMLTIEISVKLCTSMYLLYPNM